MDLYTQGVILNNSHSHFKQLFHFQVRTLFCNFEMSEEKVKLPHSSLNYFTKQITDSKMDDNPICRVNSFVSPSKYSIPFFSPFIPIRWIHVFPQSRPSHVRSLARSRTFTSRSK